MSKKQIPIDIMSATALARARRCQHMGLEVNQDWVSLASRRSWHRPEFPTDFIEIDDGREEPDPVRVEPPKQRHIPNKRSVQLRIEPQEKPGGNDKCSPRSMASPC